VIECAFTRNGSIAFGTVHVDSLERGILRMTAPTLVVFSALVGDERTGGRQTNCQHLFVLFCVSVFVVGRAGGDEKN
jgi:hypothetical protein